MTGSNPNSNNNNNNNNNNNPDAAPPSSSSSSSTAVIRPSASSLQACKGKITELYARWMSSASGEQVIQSLIREALAASRNPATDITNTNPSTSSPSASPSPPNQGRSTNPDSDFHNSTTPTPNSTTAASESFARRGGPTTMMGAKFFASVDEVDAAAMHQRANSPGASSPVSPNTASMLAARGGGGGTSANNGGASGGNASGTGMTGVSNSTGVIDPSLPRGPQNSSSSGSRNSSSAERDASPGSTSSSNTSSLQQQQDLSRSPLGPGSGSSRFIDPIPMNLDSSFGSSGGSTPTQQQQQHGRGGAGGGGSANSAEHQSLVTSMINQDSAASKNLFASTGANNANGFGQHNNSNNANNSNLNNNLSSISAVTTKPASFNEIAPFFYPRGQTAASSSSSSSSTSSHHHHHHHHQSSSSSSSEALQEQIQSLTSFFAPPGSRATATSLDVAHRGLKRNTIGNLCTEVFGLPSWMRGVIFKKMLSVSQLPDNGPATVIRIAEAKRLLEQIGHLTVNRRLFEVIKGAGNQSSFLGGSTSGSTNNNNNNRNNSSNSNNNITFDDLIALVRSVVDYHPGLEFLTQEEFQSAYCRTVAFRILFHHDPHGTRTLTWSEFNKSAVPDILMQLDGVADINQVMDYFSYEHFYVLYCRFWELDTDKDLHINLADLREYNGGTVCTRALERVIQGKGRKLTSTRPGYMNFEDFVYFCLAEEDKASDAARRYWFHVIDIDCDGIISGYELNYFFDEQQERLIEITGPENPLKGEDLLCQTLDMIAPKLPREDGIRLEDVRRCEGPVEVFFNLFVNTNKFLNFENRDPFEDFRSRQAPERNAWDRFARSEYDRLAREAMQQ